MTLYPRSTVTPNTRATAEEINAETAKIKAAIDTLSDQIANLSVGAGITPYNWVAYADSFDGTVNFSFEPGERSYIGMAYNKATLTPDSDPSLYQWARFRGQDGGTLVERRYLRQYAPPSTPTGSEPSGWVTQAILGPGALWVTEATKRADGVLLSAWSAPFRLTPAETRVYSAAVTYYESDTVTYGGGTYAALSQTVGNAPSGTSQDNAFWRVVAAPGGAGTPATPPSAFTATIDLTTTTAGVNLRTLATDAGYAGMSDATITFNVPSGVTVTGLAGGGKAIDTGSWPTDYTIDLTLVVKSGGTVLGGGGAGGAGGSGFTGSPGGSGGDAIYCRAPIDVTIEAGGVVRAGGGGGGGGAGGVIPLFGGYEFQIVGGGGGGGGAPNGPGGAGGEGDFGAASSGANGTTGGGGAGGSGLASGGAGGGYATAGTAASSAAGGAAGYAVRKNGITVPVSNSGTMAGVAA